MKQCAECGRRGFLLRLDPRRLCEDCATRLDGQLDLRVGKVRRSLAAVDAMRDVDWIVEELGRAEVQCRELGRLESAARGRPSARTETLLRTVAGRRDRELNRWAESVGGAAARQVERLSSPEEKMALVHEALQRLQGYQDELVDGNIYRDQQRALSTLLVGLRAEVSEEPAASVEPALQLHDMPQPRSARVEPGPPAAPEDGPSNRRRVPRARRQFQVTLAPGENRCLAEDISSNGILLRSTQEQYVGDFLDLRLDTAKGRYHATGVVVWTGRSEETRGLPNTLGVAFTGGVPVAAA